MSTENKEEPVTFDSPIISVSVVKTDSVQTNLPEDNLIDKDPRKIIIDNREEGTWESITRKCLFNTSDGVQKIYFTIGFHKVNGIHNGKEIVIERPLELFVPSSQNSQTQEWVTATMRLLSMSARTGTLAKALTDLRQIRSENIIWYGKYKSGKTRTHPSLVSAIAWAIQEELSIRGFLNDNYEEQSLEVMLKVFNSKTNELPIDKSEEFISLIKAENYLENHELFKEEIIGLLKKDYDKSLFRTEKCPQPSCGGEMLNIGGCFTCSTCSYSKCD